MHLCASFVLVTVMCSGFVTFLFPPMIHWHHLLCTLTSYALFSLFFIKPTAINHFHHGLSTHRCPVYILHSVLTCPLSVLLPSFHIYLCLTDVFLLVSWPLHYVSFSLLPRFTDLISHCPSFPSLHHPSLSLLSSASESSLCSFILPLVHLPPFHLFCHQLSFTLWFSVHQYPITGSFIIV